MMIVKPWEVINNYLRSHIWWGAEFWTHVSDIPKPVGWAAFPYLHSVSRDFCLWYLRTEHGALPEMWKSKLKLFSQRREDFVTNRPWLCHVGKMKIFGKSVECFGASISGISSGLGKLSHPPMYPSIHPASHPLALGSRGGCLALNCVLVLQAPTSPASLVHTTYLMITCPSMANLTPFIFYPWLLLQPSVDSLSPTLDNVERLSTGPFGVRIQGHFQWHPGFHWHLPSGSFFPLNPSWPGQQLEKMLMPDRIFGFHLSPWQLIFMASFLSPLSPATWQICIPLWI